MKYVRMWATNGYTGCRYEEYYTYEDDYPNSMIEADNETLVEEVAEDFSYVATGWDEEFEDEEAYEEYLEGCEGDWEYITEEEYREYVGE